MLLRRASLAAWICFSLLPRSSSAADVFTAGSVRLLVGGEASMSGSRPHDDGYFNSSDYDQNLLRLRRLRLMTQLDVGSRLALLSELRYTDSGGLRFYALYLRARPFAAVPVDLQAGQIPPLFGAFPRRAYASDNPLVGTPLAYQYLVALRPDAAPAKTADLLDMRGRGWFVSYPLGSPTIAGGMAAVNSVRWDTGASACLTTDRLQVALAVTQGSPSNPVVRDDNAGKALSAHVGYAPSVGLAFGVSAARGRYLRSEVEQLVGRGERVQGALGLDAEYSRGRFLARSEVVAVSWDLPVADPMAPEEKLSARAEFLETRVKVMPGVSVAARVEEMVFGDVTTAGGRLPWEFDVRRIEAAVDFNPHRNVLLKFGGQRNWRAAGYVREQSLLTGEIVLWF